MRKHRGQSAIEYLMTYGWAILVVIGVGVVLWQMGVFDLSPSTTPRCRGFSQVRPMDWSLTGGGSLMLVLVNEAGTILNMTANSVNASTMDGYDCGFGPSSNIEKLRPGQTVTIDLPLACGSMYSQGRYYRVYIDIDYHNPSSGLDHTSTGVCWGNVE